MEKRSIGRERGEKNEGEEKRTEARWRMPNTNVIVLALSEAVFPS